MNPNQVKTLQHGFIPVTYLKVIDQNRWQQWRGGGEQQNFNDYGASVNHGDHGGNHPNDNDNFSAETDPCNHRQQSKQRR